MYLTYTCISKINLEDVAYKESHEIMKMLTTDS